MAANSKSSSNIVSIKPAGADSLDWQVSELLALLKAGREISNILDSQRLYPIINKILKDRYGATNMAFFVFNSVDETFYQVYSSGLAKARVNFKCNHELLWGAIKTNQPFLVADKARKPLFPAFFKQNDLDQLKSIIWIPLVINKNVLGLITTGLRQGGKGYSGYELMFLKQIADFIASSLNTCLLYEKQILEKKASEKNLKNLSTLYNIGRALTVIQDLENLLGYILKEAVEITHSEQGAVLLFDQEKACFQVRVLEGVSEESAAALTKSLEATRSTQTVGKYALRALMTGKALLKNTAKNENKIPFGDSVVNSMACIPMAAFGDVIGVIVVANKKGKNGFTKVDLGMLEGVADQAAVAVNKAQLWGMATTDSLTGLYIRRFFLAKVSEEVRRSKRYSKTFSIVMLDIDRFKKVNDTYGHQVGDQVLKFLGKMLQETTRDMDITSRFGGEEFVLLFPETNKEYAILGAERIKKKVEAHKSPEYPKITISLGVATFPDDGEEVDQLIKKADAALYHAKRTGRNKVVAYSEESSSYLKKTARIKII